MILFPAIDLKDGVCVRLFQGDMTQDTVYNSSPSDQAQKFAAAGFDWLHLVDLNGAVEGRPVNQEAVKEILKTVSLPIQLGGGIRTLQQIEDWLTCGITRVILGTVAVKNPALVAEACRLFPERIVLGLDAHGTAIATEGWMESSSHGLLDLAKCYEDMGIAAIIYTDITRDGTGQGLNMDNTIALARHVTIPVIASGGVGSLQDLIAVRNAAAQGVIGTIIGRALYDGRINPQEALLLATSPSC